MLTSRHRPDLIPSIYIGPIPAKNIGSWKPSHIRSCNKWGKIGTGFGKGIHDHFFLVKIDFIIFVIFTV